MPYFVYKVEQDRSVEYLDVFDDFGTAKKTCRERREALTPEDTCTVRMVFAKNKKEAENLLRTPRKPSTPVEEWEG
jgi:hypothetical protein